MPTPSSGSPVAIHLGGADVESLIDQELLLMLEQEIEAGETTRVANPAGDVGYEFLDLLKVIADFARQPHRRMGGLEPWIWKWARSQAACLDPWARTRLRADLRLFINHKLALEMEEAVGA